MGGMSDGGGVSSKHSVDGIGGVSQGVVAVVLGSKLKLCAGVEKSIAPATQNYVIQSKVYLC